jgi:hypothetical protein
MAVGITFAFPGVTTEQYDELCRVINNGQLMKSLSDWPKGCLMHVVGTTPEGVLHATDVWESLESFQAYGETLMPVMQQLGIALPEPAIFEVYNFVKE